MPLDDPNEFDLPDDVDPEDFAPRRIAHAVLDVPQNLVLEAAVGLEPFADICARYGYTPDQTKQLGANAGFQVQVSRAAAEMSKEGVTFRLRAKHAAEDLIGDIWTTAKKTSTGLMQKIEAFKVLSKMGDMEPKNTANVAAGAGFSITINIPAAAVEEKAVEVIDDVEFKMELPKAAPRALNRELALPEGWSE